MPERERDRADLGSKTTHPSDDVLADLMEHVREDKEQTVEFIERLLTLRTGVAGFAATLWTASIGVSVTSGSSLPGWVGSFIVALAAYLDLTYLVHYRAMLNKTRELEQAVDAYFKYRLRTAGRDQSRKLLVRHLLSLELGQVSRLHGPTLRAMWRSRDHRTWLFLSLIVAGPVIALCT